MQLDKVFKADRIIGHFVAYDLACVWEHYPQFRSVIWDCYNDKKIYCTKCGESLLQIADGARYKNDLASITKRRYGVTLDKTTWRLSFDTLENTPLKDWPAEAVKYALNDVISTHQIYIDQLKDAQQIRYNMFEAEATRQAMFSFVLHLTSASGLTVDADRVQKLQREIEPEIQACFKTLKKEGLIRQVGKKESKSMEKIRALIQASYVGNIPKTTKGDKLSTNAKVLKKCEHPLLKTLSRYDKLSKLKSTESTAFRPPP